MSFRFVLFCFVSCDRLTNSHIQNIVLLECIVIFLELETGNAGENVNLV